MKLFETLFGLFIALCLVGSPFHQMVNSTVAGKAKNKTLMGVKTNETLLRQPRRHHHHHHHHGHHHHHHG